MAICVFDVFDDGRTEIPQDTALTGPGRYRWWHFDLDDPALNDWAHAVMDDIPADALVQQETRPRCDTFRDGLMLNLRGVNLNAGAEAEQMISVRMWAEEAAIVTVRRSKVFAIDEIRVACGERNAPPTAAAFLERLIKRLTDRVQDTVIAQREETEAFEDDLEDQATPPPADLAETKRGVIKLLRYLEPQTDALNKLARMDMPLIPEPDTLKLREIANRSTIAVEELESLRDRMAAVQDAHEAHADARLARNGYVLSVVAAVFLPLGFLTGLFGVNVAGMPGVESPLAFPLLSLSMVVIAVLMVLAMKWMKWL